MPKYHLVSDLLNDLLVANGDNYEWGTLRKIIEYQWHEGKIELLIQHQDEEAPTAVGPLRRTLHMDSLPSGERWIKCAIYYRRDSGALVEEFKDPSISDKDFRYVKQKAAEAGLILELAEQESNPETQPETHSGMPEHPTAGKPGRKPGLGTIDDTAPLLRMLELLARSEVPSVNAAATRVAPEASGQSLESTRQRLRGKFSARHGTEPPHGRTWADVLCAQKGDGT